MIHLASGIQTGRLNYLIALLTTWSQKEFHGILTSDGNLYKISNDSEFSEAVNLGSQLVFFTASSTIYNRLKSRNDNTNDLAQNK